MHGRCCSEEEARVPTKLGVTLFSALARSLDDRRAASIVRDVRQEAIEPRNSLCHLEMTCTEKKLGAEERAAKSYLEERMKSRAVPILFPRVATSTVYVRTYWVPMQNCTQRQDFVYARSLAVLVMHTCARRRGNYGSGRYIQVGRPINF